MTREPENGARRQADVIIARLELQTSETLKAVTEIKLWLMGDGTASNPGVMVRLDRLEIVEKNKENDAASTKNWRLGLGASVVLLFLERFGHYMLAWLSKATR